MYGLASLLMTAGWPGWIPIPRPEQNASTSDGLPFVVASPTRLAVIVLVAVVFLSIWFNAHRR